jgi:alpha-L-arabinofuranosidase
MQKLFSTNAGTSLLASQLDGAALPMKESAGRVGVGTWYTSAEFDNVKVVNNDNGCILGMDCFLPTSHWWSWTDTTSGDWGVKKGKLVQKDTWMADNLRGAVTFFGDTDWTNYTYTVEATKLEGSEGFIIPFAAQDKDNYWFWNIGGWGNTVSCLQQVENGIKTGRVPGTVKDFAVEAGKTYEIKVVVNGYNAKGYIDGELMFDKDLESGTRSESYQVVSTDESGDIIIKLVNVTGSDRSFAIDIANADVKGTATVYQVAGDSLDNDNILGAKEDCIMEEFTVDGISGKFNYTVPMYSATVIRIAR